MHRAIQASSAGGVAGFFSTEIEAVNNELGREADDPRTSAILWELVETGYVEAKFSMGSTPRPHLIRLTEKGSQQVAGWPSRPGEDLYPALLAALEERIANATPGEQPRLEKLRDGIVAVGQGVVTGVLTDVARRGL